jgi:hypothetical protein
VQRHHPVTSRSPRTKAVWVAAVSDMVGLTMARTAFIGAVVTLLAALVAVSGGALGITTVWPVLLAVAVGLAGPLTLGRLAAYTIGALTGWLTTALAAGLLPQTGLADAIALAVAVVVVTVIAAVTADRLPLWAGLAGYAAFVGYYEPTFAANPTLFLSESPIALLTVLLAGALGFAIAGLAQLLTADMSEPATGDGADALLVEGEVL